MDTYRSLWKEVSEENRTNLYDEQGRYLVRSQSTNCARYIQKILNRLKTDTVTGIELFCSPNPVSTDGVIEFYLPVPVIVSLQINSENGRVITNLMENRSMQAGWQRIYWDGKNKDGSTTQTGIYLITLTTDTQRKTISIVVY